MKKFSSHLAKTALGFVTLALLSSCTNWVAGHNDKTELKHSSEMWGVPKTRPVVFGFTGIDRDCTEKDPCPSEQAKK